MTRRRHRLPALLFFRLPLLRLPLTALFGLALSLAGLGFLVAALLLLLRAGAGVAFLAFGGGAPVVGVGGGLLPPTPLSVLVDLSLSFPGAAGAAFRPLGYGRAVLVL